MARRAREPYIGDSSTSATPSMKLRLNHLLAALLLATALPAHAAPVMNLEADNLLRGAGFIKDSLHLTPNQQTLWQQVASKSAGLLRARQTRRDKLQAAFKTALQDPAQELRPLARALAQEESASAVENAELRELWLTLADALNDQQRLQASQFLLTQMERVDAPERAAGAARGEPPAGGRRQKPGAEMGGARF